MSQASAMLTDRPRDFRNRYGRRSAPQSYQVPNPGAMKAAGIRKSRLEPFPFRLNRNGALFLVLTRFLHANRYPLRWKTRPSRRALLPRQEPLHHKRVDWLLPSGGNNQCAGKSATMVTTPDTSIW